MYEQTGALEGYRILVAEDAKDIQKFMKRSLERLGAEVELASNGAEAVDRLLVQPFDVTLMDIEMPLCDGYQAAERLRAAGYQEPIVAISALFGPTLRETVPSTCFDERLAKPVELPQLIETIRHYRRLQAGEEWHH